MAADRPGWSAVDPRWETRHIDSVQQFNEALLPLADEGWLFRGQPRTWGTLIPKIDRPPRDANDRATQLALEGRSIETFQKYLKYPATESERYALQDKHIALMVLQHYGVPTRLLDWTSIPNVAAFFAAKDHPTLDGEIWAFDRLRYQEEGAKQWQIWPETTDGRDFHPQLTMFRPDLGPIDWFVCTVYLKQTFPRQNTQGGWFSLTAHFGQDHARRIAAMVGDRARHLRFIVGADLKRKLLVELEHQHNVCLGTLFPDAAGAAATAFAGFPIK